MADAALHRRNPARIHAAIRKGLTMSYFDKVRRSTGLNQDEFLKLINLPSRTYARRRERGERFKATESERIVRVSLLFDLAARVLGGREKAQRWMRRPNVGLGGAKPIDLATTEQGARAVEDALMGIEHGVYA